MNASTTSAYTFSGVPVGTYTLTPSDIYSTYLYKAAPASGNLTSGGTLSLSASYQPADGALSVTVSLPTGLPSPTVLLYQNGAEVGRFTGTSHTFTGLLPGTYEVRPQDIASGGYVYKAAPATVSVQAGKTASASLLYVKQSAYLSLTLKNVPSGATPTVRLTGSATYTYSASGTYELPLGSYSASADPLTAEGYTYTPVLSATSLNLSTPGSVYSLDVSYVENSAGISLAVSGLPSGVSATLSLSGPVSRSLNCGNGTCTFDRLLLGTYTLSAPDVRYGNYTYRATASPTSYTLSQAGQTATGTVSYQAVTGALSVTVTAPAGMPSPTAWSGSRWAGGVDPDLYGYHGHSQPHARHLLRGASECHESQRADLHGPYRHAHRERRGHGQPHGQLRHHRWVADRERERPTRRGRGPDRDKRRKRLQNPQRLQRKHHHRASCWKLHVNRRELHERG